MDIFGNEQVVFANKQKKEKPNLFTNHDAFINKFSSKLTTDDCYTPMNCLTIKNKKQTKKIMYISDIAFFTLNDAFRAFAEHATYDGKGHKSLLQSFDAKDYKNAVLDCDHSNSCILGFYQVYFDKIVEHKIAVWKAGQKMKHLLAFPDFCIFNQNLWFHDLSKFDSREASAMVTFNFKDRSKNTPEQIKDFDKAVDLHYYRNVHHPECWQNRQWVYIDDSDEREQVVTMNYLYVCEMIADWRGASASYGGCTKDWWAKNKNRWNFCANTKSLITKYSEGEFYFS